VTAQLQLESPLTINWETRPEAAQPRAILAYSISSQYLVPTDEFQITFYDSDPVRLRGLALEPVQLELHGEVVLVGRIERVQRGTNGAVSVSGRDYLSQLTESSLDPTVKITADQTLSDVILYCAGPAGISSVSGVGGTGSLKPGERKPESGQSIFDFLNRIAARLGVTMQPSTSRDLVLLDKPLYQQPAAETLFRTHDPAAARSNNIVTASSTEDYTAFPTVGVSSGKVAKAGETPTTASTEYDIPLVYGDLSPRLAEAIDKTAKGRRKPNDGPVVGSELYRLLFVKDEQSRTAEQVERAIVRAASERVKSALEYTVTMQGHRTETGAVRRIGTVNEVADDVCDIAEPLWVSGLRHSYERGRGSTTEMTHWILGALQL
jgi:prophage tail gpP-like protein